VTNNEQAAGDNHRMPRLILGSASPRRRMLLSQMGLDFDVVTPEVDEAPVVQGTDRDIADQVVALAQAKVDAVAARLSNGGSGGGREPASGSRLLIIGADTIVRVDGVVLGKPVDAEDAVDMLRCLAGRTHEVFTGVMVLDPLTGKAPSGAERTAVTFAPLTEQMIRRYVATGEPTDKAGAYAVQGLGSLFIERIDGCYFNVVGLPLSLLGRLLLQHGYDVADAW